MTKSNTALLASLVLHAVLIAAIAALRLTPEPGSGVTMNRLEIALVAPPALSTEAATDVPDAPGGAHETSATGTPTPQTQTPETPAPSQDPTPLARAPEAVPTDVPAADAGPPAGTAADPVRPPASEASPATPERMVATATDAPIQVATQRELRTREPRAREPQTREPQSGRSPVTDTPPPAAESAVATSAEPIDTREAEQLEAALKDLAGDFAAMTSGPLDGDWLDADWLDGDSSYEAIITHNPGSDSPAYDEAVVTISTVRNGRRLSTDIRMRRLGFSHYAQFVDRWDDGVQIHDDEIDGRFHSNDAIRIQRSRNVQPAFLGMVTTAQRIDTSRSDRRVNRDEVFLGGFETRVDRIPLPAGIALLNAAELDDEQVMRFTEDTRIRFESDGAFHWASMPSRRDLRKGVTPETGRSRLPSSEAFYLVAEDGASLHVAGIVNGNVLMYAARDIVIEGDLIYASHPVDTTSDDLLGLVAERSIEIAEPDITGHVDVEVHAAIYARSQFAVRHYFSSGDRRNRRSQNNDDDSPGANLLRIIGSVTAGTLSATEPRFGTELIFDKRLTQLRPPSFPVTDRYEIADWDGRWSIDP